MIDNTKKKQELIEMINKASKTDKLGETIRVVFFEMMRLNFTSEDIRDVLENTVVTSEELDELINKDKNQSKER